MKTLLKSFNMFNIITVWPGTCWRQICWSNVNYVGVKRCLLFDMAFFSSLDSWIWSIEFLSLSTQIFLISEHLLGLLIVDGVSFLFLYVHWYFYIIISLHVSVILLLLLFFVFVQSSAWCNLLRFTRSKMFASTQKVYSPFLTISYRIVVGENKNDELSS